MTNHYHLLVETVDGNLSKGMRQLNGVYTQRFNRRHGMVGHPFQGRYKAILVQKDAYLLELTRYVVLNRLRARMVGRLEDWPWSSYRSMIGEANAPDWRNADWLLSQFGRERESAIESYRRFVMEGKGLASPLDQTRHQLLLGDDAFVARYRQDKKPEELREVSKAHRRSIALPLDDYRQRYSDRNEAMARAYLSGVRIPLKMTADSGIVTACSGNMTADSGIQPKSVTFARNHRSRSNGIGGHVGPEYARRVHHVGNRRSLRRSLYDGEPSCAVIRTK